MVCAACRIHTSYNERWNNILFIFPAAVKPKSEPKIMALRRVTRKRSELYLYIRMCVCELVIHLGWSQWCFLFSVHEPRYTGAIFLCLLFESLNIRVYIYIWPSLMLISILLREFVGCFVPSGWRGEGAKLCEGRGENAEWEIGW